MDYTRVFSFQELLAIHLRDARVLKGGRVLVLEVVWDHRLAVRPHLLEGLVGWGSLWILDCQTLNHRQESFGSKPLWDAIVFITGNGRGM